MHRMKSHGDKSAAHEGGAGMQHGAKENMHYVHLGIMVLLHFMAMFALMYAMVDSFDHIYPNNNQLYMAGMMTSPMLLIELSLMGAMYPKRKLNALILALAGVALVGFFFLIREQAAIGDTQFLKSMIPHHSGALLMCREAEIQDAEIRDLCTKIIAGQTQEIAQMEAILDRLAR